jgi:two-component system NtrC family response regulator
MATATILLIEDDAETRRLLARVLQEAPEQYQVLTQASGRHGLDELERHPVDCVLVDYRLIDVDGLTCLRQIRASHPTLPVIMVTGAGSEEIAVEAMKLGATDYVVKHGHYLRLVPGIVREALGRRTLGDVSSFGDTPGAELPASVRARFRARGIIGESPALAHAIGLAERAASSRVTVLLEGDTGTGKEMFARGIHAEGPRADRPFVAQNCAALPESLLESELFGHARGAFTGADRARAGLLVDTDGGTLFLDEIGEMSLPMQAKLLRVLQDGVVRPLGSSETRQVDVRIIAATNRDLPAATKKGLFRADLHYRLRAFPIRLPPLRERPEDVRELAIHFLRHWGDEEGTAPGAFAPETLRLLEAYAWPGNVRELEHEVHRLVLCTEPGRSITPDLLPAEILAGREDDDGEAPLKDIVRRVEAAAIQDRLRRHGYHRTRTAHSLGVTREWLWAKMRRLGLFIRNPQEDDSSDDPEPDPKADAKAAENGGPKKDRKTDPKAESKDDDDES